jgi:hypothetical protein
MKNQKILFAVCCLMATLVAGCGSSSAPPGASINGVFADAPVVGLSFACGTQKGVTGAGGTFTCPAGSNVTFSVGGITVCTAPVLAKMTPVSCAQANGTPSASAATLSVLAVARYVISISTTPGSSGALTITSSELQAAAGLTLNFSTATDADLLAAVTATTANPAATLVDSATAQAELTNTVVGAIVGNYTGTFSGSSSGTWTAAIASDGSVSGTATGSNTVTVSGSLVAGTQYSGTAGSATWTGTVDTSKSPNVFSGTWTNGSDSGTFTGHD